MAKEIVSTLNSLAKNTFDPRLKNRFNACAKYYKTAFDNLDGAKRHLRVLEDEASEESGACEGHFIIGKLEEPKILSNIKNNEFEFRIALAPVAIEWLLAKD